MTARLLLVRLFDGCCLTVLVWAAVTVLVYTNWHA